MITQGKVLMMMVLIIGHDVNHDDAIFDEVMTQGKVLMMMVLIFSDDINHDDALFDKVLTQGNNDNHDDAIFDKVMTHRVNLKMVLGRAVVEGRVGPSRASSK